MSRSSNLRASSSSGNPYGRTNDDIEAASIGPKTTLVPDSCPECGTALREGGKLNGLSRINKFCTLGKGNVMSQMERPAYLQDANPGKILRHQLDGSCYQVDDQDVQRGRGCLVLTINVSIYWADPSESRNRSLRSTGPTMYCLLHRLLLPLAVDLSVKCDGLWIKTPRYPNGKLPGLEPFAAIGLPLSPSLDAPIPGGRIHLVTNVWYELASCTAPGSTRQTQV
ncbi:hypothetical protein C350_06168 [Cryptococcus neoformans MW-RSA36]|nr:hypothetical protein C350_06168 [Cryptococcus neoformans var. grubii MW-RSA36]